MEPDRSDEPEGAARDAAHSARPPWVHGGEAAVPEPTAERRRRLRSHRFEAPTVEEIRTPAPPDAGDAGW